VGAYQAEFPAYVRPLRFARSLFGGRLLLVQHNVEYERIRGQVPELTEKNFRTLKNLELAMCALADAIVAVSDKDRDRMIADGVPGEKIHLIPHGVDLRRFRETPVADLHERFGLPRRDRILAYHGTYSYPPNLEAMQVMAGEILPRLERHLGERGISLSVLAIGSHPPNFPLHEKIHFVGSITELAEVLPGADLAVVPLLDGGGTRMKILDYFAAGVPVISTSKGIEGIPVTHGQEALIVDDFDRMADEVARLLEHPEAAQRLAERASAFVETLDWDAIARRYLPLMQ
jgi:glycosyltransferase involved in cell wall biosynthesis